MILILAALFAAQPVAGCFSIGPALHCDLPPIAAIPVTLPITTPIGAATVHAPAQRDATADRPARRKTSRRARAGRADEGAAPLDGERIAAHIESLVSIGDCTGARTFARLIGDSGLADQAFTRCLMPQAAPQVSAAR